MEPPSQSQTDIVAFLKDIVTQKVRHEKDWLLCLTVLLVHSVDPFFRMSRCLQEPNYNVKVYAKIKNK